MDMNMLRGIILMKGMNVTKVAERVGISRTAFYRKMHKPGQFTVGEITKIKSILGLTDDEAIRIFLGL